MEDELVHNCNQILCLLLPKGTHVNDMIEKTGLGKTKVFKANEFLVKARLVTKLPNKTIHKQKLFVHLTELGAKIANLIKNLDNFEKIYEIYIASEEVNFQSKNHLDFNVRKNLLFDKGWTKDEIKDYERNFEYIKDFEVDSLDILLDSLVNTYGLYVLKFNLNTYAKEYITKLFSDKIAFYLQKKFDKIIVPIRDYKKNVHIVERI